MWIRDCFPDALHIRETPCHCASTFTYLFMQICFHLSQLRWQGEAKCEVQQCLQKKLTLKVSNEMKCPSDKYKRQRERAGAGEGRGGAQGDTPGNTPVTCRPNKIEIFKTFPDSAARICPISAFPVPHSIFCLCASCAACRRSVCVGGVAVGVVVGKGVY